jgi:arylsulfatase
MMRQRRSIPRARATTRLVLPSTLVLLTSTMLGCGEEPESLTFGSHPIVLVDLSGVRADHLGFYGYERDTSPILDALAAESVVFEWAFTPSALSGPAQAAIATGAYPPANGVLGDGDVLADDAVTLAEALGARGYRTAAFVDGGYLDRGFGLAQGFEVYEDGGGAGLAAAVTAALAWLEEHQGDDVFVLVHGGDALAPYAPSIDASRFLGELETPEGFTPTRRGLERLMAEAGEGGMPPATVEYAKALYDAELCQVDSALGRLVEGLRGLGLDARATLAVVSDHGQEFGEHGALLNTTAYATVTRVPMLLRLPGGMVAQRISRPVGTVDLAPTLLAAARVELPDGMQGRSLLGLARQEGRPPYMAFSDSSIASGDLAIAVAGYRLLVPRTEGGPRLFNLLEDPLEQNDLAVLEPEKVAVLGRRLEAWQRSVVPVAAGDLDDADQQTLEQLRNLGYVQ